ncbi:MAG: cytochrome C oxidase subunit IV family protein [Opitutaceae bacterium]
METTHPPLLAPHQSRYQLFVGVAILLSFITGAEIVAIWLPWVHWFLVGLLVVLSAVKFGYVIFVFMHLRWDRRLCTALFLTGLLLAGGTALALIRLFAVGDSIPLTSQEEPPAPPASSPH